MVDQETLDKISLRQKHFRYFLWSRQNMQDPTVIGITMNRIERMNLFLRETHCKYQNFYLFNNIDEVKECFDFYISEFLKSKYAAKESNVKLTQFYLNVFLNFYEDEFNKHHEIDK